ncbi:DUF1799 domain-containing protein [Pseudomonas coleopterorum]|uniref:DUF1799 domain-containing protein n=1 Tax=Pseudomonas coleopterorum TaxID=1605838 RepID=UPI000894BBDB|nr:DUF1799 domain-containing protein [Pseudomonas coleopterorum]SEE38781.1 Phage related hypothetical protein [Pseudomonas coleopterorum]
MLYEAGPSAAEVGAFGLTLDQIPQEECYVWPENWPSFCVFESMTTQWRSGPGGATGLDYVSIPVVMRLVGVEKKRRPMVFEDVRVMEAAALGVMADERSVKE